MTKKIKHIGVAVLVFVLLSAAFIWFTGKKPPGLATNCATEHAECNEHAEHPTDERKEEQMCEHNKRTIDCDNCRFEVGAVKISATANPLISVGLVEERPAVDILALTGEVQFDQTTLVDIVPPGSGRLTQIKTRLGQLVKAGDIMAIIQSPSFGEAKAAFLKAYTNLEITQQEQKRQVAINNALGKALKQLNEGQELAWEKELANNSGDTVKELMGEFKSKLGTALSRLKLARSVFGREKGLWEKQISSKSDYEAASQELQSAQADYTALLEELQLNMRVNGMRTENAVKQAEAEFKSTEQALHTFGLNDSEMKAIPGAQETCNFALMEIKAPRTGTVVLQNASEGKLVDAAQSLFTIADLSNLWVWCNVYEKDIALLQAKLHEGQPPQAAIKVAAFTDVTFPGRVDLIGSTVDERTRTIKVRIQVKNEQAKLKPGMFANVEILIPSGKNINVLPQQAVLSNEGKFFVFRHLKDDLWLRKDVTTGKNQGQYIEILDGVAKGDKVVTGGAFMLKSDILREKMGAGCAD